MQTKIQRIVHTLKFKYLNLKTVKKIIMALKKFKYTTNSTKTLPGT